MKKSIEKVHLGLCLRLLLFLFILCDLSGMMAMQRAYHLPIQPRKETLVSNPQNKKNFDPRNNEIALLRELCAVDSADTSGKANKLEFAIKKFSLEKLINLSNFTAEQGFSKSGDVCYIRIDQLMDDRLLHEAKSWLGKLMNDHFFNTNDYQQFKRLNVLAGERILKLLWDDLNIKDELLRVATIFPTCGLTWKRILKEIADDPDIKNEKLTIFGTPFKNTYHRTKYINKLGSGNNLAGFLRGVKEIYLWACYKIGDEKWLKLIEEHEQAQKEREEEQKKWWYGLWYWLFK